MSVETEAQAGADGVRDGAPLLEVEHLRVLFPVKSGAVIARTVGHVHAVDDVSFELREGETLGIVGESGCGKTTLIRTLVRLIDASSGTIRYRGEDITKAGRKELEPIRRQMQMVFQDPQSSLNPRKRVGQILATPLKIREVPKDRIEAETHSLLDRVGLQSEHLNRFPHEFSGGQRQRIGIARALALDPKLIMLDEPVSALDVSIQAQVINLLDELQDEFHLSYVFVAHDLGVVRHVSDRILVMYLGKLVEISPAEELLPQADPPLHLGAAQRDPDSGSKGEPGARAADRQRGAAQPDQPAGGLPLPHPLPAGDRGVQDGRAATDRVRERPCGRMPSPPERERGRGGGGHARAGQSSQLG